MKILKSLAFLFFLLSTELLFAQELKVMTYNIKYDNVNDTVNNWNDRKEAMVDLIEHYDAAIIGAQEVLHRQLIYLDSCLTHLSHIGVGRDDGKQKGEYSPILYNSIQYKVLEHNTFWLSDTPDKISVGWDASMERICTYGLFEEKKSGIKFYVFNTHFDHRGHVAREKSAELVIQKIKQINTENYPVILMGDFNLTPDQDPILQIKDYLDDGQEITQKPFYGPSGTSHGFDHQRVVDTRIDYIFVKRFKVENYIHIDDRIENNKHISDHLPVLISVKNL